MDIMSEMKIIPLELSDFSLVEVKTTNECNPTPHCKKHGAMNKITVHADGGGFWRCLSVHSYRIVKFGNSISRKENDCACRAGCLQVGQKSLPLKEALTTKPDSLQYCK